MAGQHQYPHPHSMNHPHDDQFVIAMQQGNWNSFDVLISPHLRAEIREIVEHECTPLQATLLELYKKEAIQTGEKMVTFLQEANWKNFVNLLRVHHNRAASKMDEDGHTFLHVAILAGEVELVKELVKLMTDEDLMLKKDNGHTALPTAIQADMDEIVVLMVKTNEKLVTVRDGNGLLPVAFVARSGNTEMTRFLYS